jgi:DNA-binding protein H-NS
MEMHMSSYQDILNQIEDLKRKAEQVRKDEMAGAIAEIKRQMAQFGITAEDLGFGGRAGRGKGRAAIAAKYRDPVSGKTWSGRGRRPRWVAEQESQGKSLDAFRVS